MASTSQLRTEVLQCFKSLHRARQAVFNGDSRALTEGRNKINEEFRKQKHIEDAQKIQNLIDYSKGIEHELRTCVIQAQEVSPGTYRANITKDTVKLDNVSFNEECVSDLDSRKQPNSKSSCS